jgi:hypothetical protein
MKAYPSIPYWNQGHFNTQCYVFDKLDGSNIRCEWSKKRGWYKFGTRKRMIDENDDQFGDAITIFLNKYGDELDRVFRTEKSLRNTDSFVTFSEYYGASSFAGIHFDDEQKDVVLIDVNQHKKGIIPPLDFIDIFGHTGIPEILYSGLYTEELVELVRNNELTEHDLKEGVVVKGSKKTKRFADNVWMCKIKTNQWLLNLRDKKGHAELLRELNGDKTLIKDFE